MRAVRDARGSDADAAAWVTDARAVEFWALPADREPRDFARRAASVLSAFVAYAAAVK